eukprot:3691015-Rhodomonas_salina.1
MGSLPSSLFARSLDSNLFTDNYKSSPSQGSYSSAGMLEITKTETTEPWVLGCELPDDPTAEAALAETNGC